MKKVFILLLSALYASNIFSQKMLYDDIICPDGGEKGNTAITYTYWTRAQWGQAPLRPFQECARLRRGDRPRREVILISSYENRADQSSARFFL